MSKDITAWTAVRPPAIDEVVPFVSMTHRDDGRVSIVSRDAGGRQVEVVIPGREWTRMAQEISWNAPKRAAALSARRMGMAPVSGPA